MEKSMSTKRGSIRVTELVISFLASLMERDKTTFFGDDLRTYVHEETNGFVGPEVATRTLRLLRQRKRISYTVVNADASLYEFMGFL